MDRGLDTLPDPSSLTLAREETIPVAVLTGFLGSGKTTLIRALLADPAFAGTAIVVNEFGEIGLDHLLIEASTKEDTILLEGGCLCCATRGDLVRALRSLLDRRERSELPPYARVIVETSGLADPAPILQTMMSDPLRLSRYRLAGLTTTIDALLGAETLERHAEARRQAALADRIVLTKEDLASEAQRGTALKAVRAISPAPVVSSSEFSAGLFSSTSALRDIPHHHAHGDYFSASRNIAAALPWPHVEAWLATLIDRLGPKLLRLKALLAIEGEAGPVVLHAVQHVIHRPEKLSAWPAGLREGRITLIAEGIPTEELEAFLAALVLPPPPQSAPLVSTR